MPEDRSAKAMQPEKARQNPAEVSILPKCSAAEALSSLSARSLSRLGWELLQQLHPNEVERELVSFMISARTEVNVDKLFK